jgi:glutaryl-CoA dehydrogenase
MGCFGLTEPTMVPGSMITNFKDMGDHYLLNGAKMWISNAPLQISLSFGQKNEEGRIHGLIVERGMEGFTHQKRITNGLRASSTGEPNFEQCTVPHKQPVQHFDA